MVADHQENAISTRAPSRQGVFCAALWRLSHLGARTYPASFKGKGLPCGQAYGAQAVVVSIDPRRVYVADPSATERPTVRTARPGPGGERFCWWQCTVKVLPRENPNLLD